MHSVGVFCLILAIYSLKQQLSQTIYNRTPYSKGYIINKRQLLLFLILTFSSYLSDWASTFCFNLPAQNIHLSRTIVRFFLSFCHPQSFSILFSLNWKEWSGRPSQTLLLCSLEDKVIRVKNNMRMSKWPNLPLWLNGLFKLFSIRL